MNNHVKQESERETQCPNFDFDFAALNDLCTGVEEQQWDGLQFPTSTLEDELFKYKQALPEDERVVSPFDASSTVSSALAGDHDLREVPQWMTDYLPFNGQTANLLLQAPNDSETKVPAPHTATKQGNSSENINTVRSEFTDEALKSLSVKELNRLVKVKGLSKDQVAKIKYQRRTIKNRGYAQNCRIKRIKQKQGLEEENISLQQQIQDLQSQLNLATKERDEMKCKYKQLKKFVIATFGKENKVIALKER